MVEREGVTISAMVMVHVKHEAFTVIAAHGLSFAASGGKLLCLVVVDDSDSFIGRAISI